MLFSKKKSYLIIVFRSLPWINTTAENKKIDNHSTISSIVSPTSFRTSRTESDHSQPSTSRPIPKIENTMSPNHMEQGSRLI